MRRQKPFHLLLLLAAVTLFSPHCRSGFMGAAVGNAMMANRLDNINDFNKEQSKKLAELEEKFENFKRDIGTDGLLNACTNLVDKAKEMVAVEEKYAAYRAQNEPSLLKAPAGFRLPQYRPKWENLSSFLKTFLAVKDVLDEKTDLDDKLLKFIIPPKTVAHMRKLIAQYRSKYLEPTMPGYQPASPQEQLQLSKIENELETLEANVNRVRDGLRTYGTAVGLDIEDLNKRAEDMRDMAKDVEDILEELDKNDLGIKIQQRVVELFSVPLDPRTNQFTLPLSDSQPFLDTALYSFPEACATYKRALIEADQKIRAKATADTTIKTALTTADARNYFAANMVPPPLTQMLKTSNGHSYCYPGYLGFWIQQITDKLNEIKLAGIPIINARISCLSALNTVKTKFFMPLGTFCPDSKGLSIIEEAGNASLDMSALKKALKNPLTESSVAPLTTLFTTTLEEQKKVWKNQFGYLKNDPESCEIFLFKPEANRITPGVAELIAFRKALLLLTLIGNLLTNAPAFGPKTYTSDLIGPVGYDLFPALEQKVIA